MKCEYDNEYIDHYIHSNSKIGVLLKVKVEKPSTKDNEQLKTLIKDLCMQIAAMNVKALTKDDVDDDLIQSEKEIYIKQAKDSGKPEKIVEKIVEGKINKIYSEITLMGQNFVKDDKFTVEKYVNSISNEIGDKIVPIEFAKFSVID
jgi:elongation factor Ts